MHDYADPEAARRAVTDRLRAEVNDSRWSLSDLQRQYAYDQLVERLYRVDDGWVVKGATALLARRIAVRHTVDIDLYRAGAIGEVEEQLRRAVEFDIGDWMHFAVGPAVRISAAGAEGARIKVSSFLGARLWAAFQVDLVADGVIMTDVPDLVPPLTGVTIAPRTALAWRAYPLVDHVADKVCAILERPGGRPSTRFKDLVDLVAISRRTDVSAERQRRAMVGETRRRHLELPDSFAVPDRALWDRGYRAEAGRAVQLDAIDIRAALDVVKPFLDPVLDGTAKGRWDPEHRSWR